MLLLHLYFYIDYHWNCCINIGLKADQLVRDTYMYITFYMNLLSDNNQPYLKIKAKQLYLLVRI